MEKRREKQVKNLLVNVQLSNSRRETLSPISCVPYHQCLRRYVVINAFEHECSKFVKSKNTRIISIYEHVCL